MATPAHDEYARFARLYDPLTAPFLSPTRRSMLGQLSAGRHSPVLDVCCGTGRLLAMLHAAGFAAAGVDLSPAMLGLAARALRAAGLAEPPLHQEDASRTHFPNRHFRAATIAFALHEKTEPERRAILAETRRTTAGPILVCDYATPRGPLSRIGLALATLPERAAGGAHYRLFRDFCARGASEGLLARHGEPFTRLDSFLFGAVGLYRVGSEG